MIMIHRWFCLDKDYELKWVPFFAVVAAPCSGGRPVPPSFQYGFSSSLCKPAWGNHRHTVIQHMLGEPNRREGNREVEKPDKHLFNGLSLCPLFLFQSFFFSSSLRCGRGLHRQEVKTHPFVSLQNGERDSQLQRDFTAVLNLLLRWKGEIFHNICQIRQRLPGHSALDRHHSLILKAWTYQKPAMVLQLAPEVEPQPTHLLSPDTETEMEKCRKGKDNEEGRQEKMLTYQRKEMWNE